MEERLQKYLARAGLASRRASELLITAGRVKVNGQVVKELGTRVDGDKDVVLVDGKPTNAPTEKSWYLLYKPPGVVTTLSDPQERATISDFIRELTGRVFPVGRLDYDAEGALLLTDDGEIANKLMHPRHQVRRVYLAKVKGEPTDASIEKLAGGVRLEDGFAKPVEVSRFDKAEKNTWLRIVVTEGRPHLIKRLCAAIGHPVVRLFRPSHAGVTVDGLVPGQVRPLTLDEVRAVHKVAEGQGGPDPAMRLPGRNHTRPAGDAGEAVADEPSLPMPARKGPNRRTKPDRR